MHESIKNCSFKAFAAVPLHSFMLFARRGSSSEGEGVYSVDEQKVKSKHCFSGQAMTKDDVNMCNFFLEEWRNGPRVESRGSVSPRLRKPPPLLPHQTCFLLIGHNVPKYCTYLNGIEMRLTKSTEHCLELNSIGSLYKYRYEPALRRSKSKNHAPLATSLQTPPLHKQDTAKECSGRFNVHVVHAVDNDDGELDLSQAQQ